jgi:ABC-type multidrug transport system ATPase subunit
LSLLRGQTYFADVVGEIHVNGIKTTSLARYRDDMAFASQDDVMFDDLTVHANILYSALLFNKRGYRTSEEVTPMVLYTEEILGLKEIEYSIVGNAETRCARINAQCLIMGHFYLICDV